MSEKCKCGFRKSCGEVTTVARVEARTGDSAFFACQIRSLIRCKMLVEHRVEAARLISVSINSVLDVLGGVAVEVI